MNKLPHKRNSFGICAEGSHPPNSAGSPGVLGMLYGLPTPFERDFYPLM